MEQLRGRGLTLSLGLQLLQGDPHRTQLGQAVHRLGRAGPGQDQDQQQGSDLLKHFTCWIEAAAETGCEMGRFLYRHTLLHVPRLCRVHVDTVIRGLRTKHDRRSVTFDPDYKDHH